LRQLTESGQPDVATQVLGLFVQDAPARLAAIDAAVETGDAARLQRSAHALKGAAGTIGATALHDACRELEELGRQNTLAAAQAAVALMHHEYKRVKAEIDQLL
jgi:HPt (histidine-containing phosphotransfer) domain-containing protein